MADERPQPNFGSYQLLRRVSVGGMAEIFQARRFGDDGQPLPGCVAVKRLLPDAQDDPDLVAMFRAEAELVRQLNHRHIARLLEVGRVHGSDYIVYEFIEGHDLVAVRRRLRELGRGMDDAEVASLGLQAARGLGYAHDFADAEGRRLNVVHRDVSPQNLMIQRDGCVKLIDFGIAKFRGNKCRTQVGVLKGKHAYMSPEQVRKDQLDGRSDVFSLGIILYELASGSRVFKGDDSLMDTLERVEKADVEPLAQRAPDVDPALADVIMRCLQRDPEDRPSSAGALERTLDGLIRRLSDDRPETVLSALFQRLFGGAAEWDAAESAVDAYRESLHCAEDEGAETTDQLGHTNATMVWMR